MARRKWSVNVSNEGDGEGVRPIVSGDRMGRKVEGGRGTHSSTRALAMNESTMRLL